METVELKNIKSLLSGKNPIKKTEKGIRYRFFHSKRRGKNNQIYGICYAFFFSDYGDKACFDKFSYYLSNGKTPNTPVNNTVWFRIKDGRMIVSRGAGPAKRIISNVPQKVNFTFTGGRNSKPKSIENRLKIYLLKWAAKNGVEVKRKWYKYNFNTVSLLLSYPEFEFFLDFCKFDSYQIPSIISSNLKGIKGINHALDRLCGFHGKKLKKELSIKPNDFINKLSIARILKGLVTHDDIISIISKSIVINRLPTHKSIRYFLKNFGRDTIVNWLLAEHENILTTNVTFLKDAASQYYQNHKDNKENRLVLPETNNLNDIHNIITRNNRVLIVNKTTQETYEEQEKTFTEAIEKYQNIHNLEIGDFKVFLPEKPQTLIDASATLSNCLSSYIWQHGKVKLILLINYKNELKYAICLNFNKTIEQFYGKHNQLPNKEDYILVYNKLKEIDVVKSSYMDSSVLGQNKATTPVHIPLEIRDAEIGVAF